MGVTMICTCGHERLFHGRGLTCGKKTCQCFRFRDELTDWANRAMARAA